MMRRFKKLVRLILALGACSPAFAQVQTINASDNGAVSLGKVNSNFSYLSLNKTQIFSGVGVPTSISGNRFGDFYIRTDNNTTYQCFLSSGCTAVGAGNWQVVGGGGGGGGCVPGGSSGQILLDSGVGTCNPSLITASGTTLSASVTGNAGTATTLQTGRNINGVSFNGSADITVTAAAGTLTGGTLSSSVLASSLVSFGANPTLAGSVTLAAITGSTQCLHVNSAGIISGSGADCGTGSAAFSAITSSTNSSASMVVGTGASITTSGSGSVVATAVPVGGVSGMGTGMGTFLATPSSANLANTVTGETGSGALVFASSPTLVTPNLGVPTALTLTNATGLPIAGITGLGTGVSAALAANVSGSGSICMTVGSTCSGSPGGSTTQVQYNDTGAFAGTSGFTFNSGTNTVSLSGGVLTGVGGSSAGLMGFTQGSACTPGTTEICMYAPVSVTSYGIALPGAVGSTGVVHNTTSGSVSTWSYSQIVNADISSSAAIVLSKLANQADGTFLANVSGISGPPTAVTAGTGVLDALQTAADTTGGVCTVGGGGCTSEFFVTIPITTDGTAMAGTITRVGFNNVNGVSYTLDQASCVVDTGTVTFDVQDNSTNPLTDGAQACDGTEATLDASPVLANAKYTVAALTVSSGSPTNGTITLRFTPGGAPPPTYAIGITGANNPSAGDVTMSGNSVSGTTIFAINRFCVPGCTDSVFACSTFGGTTFSDSNSGMYTDDISTVGMPAWCHTLASNPNIMASGSPIDVTTSGAGSTGLFPNTMVFAVSGLGTTPSITSGGTDFSATGLSSISTTGACNAGDFAVATIVGGGTPVFVGWTVITPLSPSTSEIVAWLEVPSTGMLTATISGSSGNTGALIACYTP